VSALRQRHLQTYAVKNFKDILRLCDTHGVDHLTPVGATPLMLAARAGNAALVEALIDKGADLHAEDEFGHTPWLQAVVRAMEETAFAKTALAPQFERIAPLVIDVQVQGRLVRIERHQGEYWMLTLMLAGLKSQWSRCTATQHPFWKRGEGFFAEQLHQVLEELPVHLWKPLRRKRSDVNQVLARAEVDSAYLPARKLWARTRIGHYLPNPAMQLQKGDDWRPVFEALNLEWIDQGVGGSHGFGTRPAAMAAQLKDRLDGVQEEFF